jgi:CheY-like chemotaxis protein
MKILIVDDNTDILLTLSTMFEALGANVLEERHSLKVVDKVAEFCPNIIVMDIGMPEMNGYDLCRKLRDNGETCKIIAHTGWGGLSDKEKAFQPGFNDLLVKPATFEDYKRILGRE